jgi:hypothetical protein
MTDAMKALNPPILREPIEAQEWSTPTQTPQDHGARPVASLTAPYRRHNGAYRRTSSVVVTAVAGVVALGWQLVSVLCLTNSARSAQIPIILGKSDGSKSQPLATMLCYIRCDPYQSGRGRAA